MQDYISSDIALLQRLARRRGFGLTKIVSPSGNMWSAHLASDTAVQWQLLLEVFDRFYQAAYTSGALERAHAASRMRASGGLNSLILRLAAWLDQRLGKLDAPELLATLWNQDLAQARSELMRAQSELNAPTNDESVSNTVVFILPTPARDALEAAAGFAIYFGLKSTVIEPA